MEIFVDITDFIIILCLLVMMYGMITFLKDRRNDKARKIAIGGSIGAFLVWILQMLITT